MTEIMPFPENNILFYWAAPHGAAFLLEKSWEKRLKKDGISVTMMKIPFTDFLPNG